MSSFSHISITRNTYTRILSTTKLTDHLVQVKVVGVETALLPLLARLQRMSDQELQCALVQSLYVLLGADSFYRLQPCSLQSVRRSVTAAWGEHGDQHFHASSDGESNPAKTFNAVPLDVLCSAILSGAFLCAFAIWAFHAWALHICACHVWSSSFHVLTIFCVIKSGSWKVGHVVRAHGLHAAGHYRSLNVRYLGVH